MLLVGVSDIGLALVIGLATLLGTAVGGLLSWLGALRVEGRRQDFARAEKEAREEAELRSAAMLVWQELFTIDTALDAHAKSGLPLSTITATPLWDANAATVLGSRLPDYDVRVVSYAYTSIISLNGTLETVRAPGTDPAVANLIGVAVEVTAVAVRQACDLLRERGYGSQPPRSRPEDSARSSA